MKRKPLPAPRANREVILAALSAFAPRYVVEWMGRILEDRERIAEHHWDVRSRAVADMRYWQRKARDAEQVARDQAAHAKQLEDDLLHREGAR